MYNLKPITLAENDLFGRDILVQQIVDRLLDINNNVSIMALFAPWGSGRTSILNLCELEAQTFRKGMNGKKRALFLKPFDAWKMESIGNLPVALLWHIYRNLPSHISNDEKLLLKFSRASMALSAVGLNIGIKANGPGSMSADPIRSLEIISKSLPPEKKSPVSSIFSACEQIEEVAQELSLISQIICEKSDCDVLVVPIDDLDKCAPEVALSLIFTMHHLLTSKNLSLLITLDRQIICKYINIAYGNSLPESLANELVVKCFDDWVDIPFPPLDKALAQISFRGGEQFSNESEATVQMLVRAAKARSMISLASSASNCMRSLSNLEKFLKDKYQDFTPSIDSLLAWFGWCLLASSHPDQLAAILESQNYGGDIDGIEKAISSAFSRLTEKKNSEYSEMHRFNEPHALPSRLRCFIQDSNCAFMRFLSMMKGTATERQLSFTLQEIIPYL